MDTLKQGDYILLDRKEAKTPEESRTLYGRIVTADYFLTGTNAITLDGELINVDGMGNRVACLITGPQHVLVVAGMNKSVCHRGGRYPQGPQHSSCPPTVSASGPIPPAPKQASAKTARVLTASAVRR